MFKSPLAYTSSFYFIGRKNGIERKWMLYESDNETNKIDLLYESETTEGNGVKVVVPVKYGDSYSFKEKIKEQLAYFENVYFDCEGIENHEVKIVRGEDFQWSSLSRYGTMHISLDNVNYPIDWQKLGISAIPSPVALRFSLTDGLFPIPNREQLKLTEDAKQLILAKIKKVANFFVEKYNKALAEETDIFKLLGECRSNNKYIPHFYENSYAKLDIFHLSKYSDIPFDEPKIPGISILNLRGLIENKRSSILGEYEVKYKFSSGGRFQATKKSWDKQLDFDDVERKTIFEFTELSHLKKAYLRDVYGTSNILFVRKERKFLLGRPTGRWMGRSTTDYMTILNLWDYNKSSWRTLIKEFQHLISLITSGFVDADAITIPQSWFDERKKKKLENKVKVAAIASQKKVEGQLSGKVAKSLQRYVSGKNCKFVPRIVDLATSHKDKKLHLYGTTKYEDLFNKLFEIVDSKKVELVILPNRDIKVLKETPLHNWVEISKFMEGKHRVYKRIVTAYLINKLIADHRPIFDNSNILSKISTNLANKIENLKDYCENNLKSSHSEVLDSMVAVAEEHNLFDSTIYDVYKEVKFTLDKLSFLNPTFSYFSRYNLEGQQGMIDAIKDLFKYYKYRINWEHYTCPKVVEEEETEELVEEKEEELLTI